MKENIEEIANQEIEEVKGKKITRMEAIKKVGYIAVAATTMMIVLSNPQKTYAASPDPIPPF